MSSLLIGRIRHSLQLIEVETCKSRDEHAHGKQSTEDDTKPIGLDPFS